RPLFPFAYFSHWLTLFGHLSALPAISPADRISGHAKVGAGLFPRQLLANAAIAASRVDSLRFPAHRYPDAPRHPGSPSHTDARLHPSSLHKISWNEGCGPSVSNGS